MATWTEDRLELALRASKEGIWDWNLVTDKIVYSAWILRFLGYRRNEMPHFFHDQEKLMDEASAEGFNESLREVQAEETDLFSAEPQMCTKGGEWKWFRLRGTPVRDDDGNLVRLVGSVIDISQRKAAERELAEERAFMLQLMDNIPMNVYFKDVESRFVMANKPTAEKMGFDDVSGILGKSDFDFFSREHAQVARDHEVEIMESKVGQVDQMEHETWEGKDDTWVISTKQPWIGQTGKVKGIFGVTNDVSDLVRAQIEHEKMVEELNLKNLEAEKDRHLMRLLIDSVPMNVYFKDVDCRFVLVNKPMVEWFGKESSAEVHGKRDRDIFSEEHWRQAEADERRIMETGEPIVGIIEKETWGGRQDTWVMTSKYPWRNEEGEIFGTFGVSRDVSDLVRTERQLKGLASELADKNQEMEEELMLAREVQQALIPEKLPSFSNAEKRLRFHHLYRPASELAGDFLEVIPLGRDRAGFFVCDVMGHGVRSALVVSMLRGLIEKQSASADKVGEFLTGLNDGLLHLLEESGVTLFATAVYGVVDLTNNFIEMGLAGHASPVAVFEDGVRQLHPPAKARGPALGMVEGIEYGSIRADLTGLKRMICFTDGLLEAENSKGEEFGLERMIEIVERGGRLDLLLQKLVAAGSKFTGTEGFEDDVCLLGLEVRR
ncbi:MAG: PAS domain-containing protein [Verrucomicrobiaceae bacterium]